MFELGEATALFVLWLGFMTVVGVYVFRIGTLLRRQRITEREYGLRLATLRGRMAREIAGMIEV